MKEKKKRIALSEWYEEDLRESNLSVYCYRLIGLVKFVPMAGQGDVDFLWQYLCRNESGNPVLITEDYSMSVWDPNPKSPEYLERKNLYLLEEEPLTETEFLNYRKKLAREISLETICLPITLSLPAELRT